MTLEIIIFMNMGGMSDNKKEEKQKRYPLFAYPTIRTIIKVTTKFSILDTHMTDLSFVIFQRNVKS